MSRPIKSKARAPRRKQNGLTAQLGNDLSKDSTATMPENPSMRSTKAATGGQRAKLSKAELREPAQSPDLLIKIQQKSRKSSIGAAELKIRGGSRNNISKTSRASVIINRPNGTNSFIKINSRERNTDDAVRIYQIYFEPWHLELLDPNLEPFDNANSLSETYEFDVFQRLFETDATQSAQLWGALSWRFTEKTGMTGGELREVIAANPGYDVYYCNPYPQHESLFHNMWLQGETCHPRFIEVTKEVFKAVGIPENYLFNITDNSLFSASNYFIGNNKFWKLYIAFVKRVIGLSESRLPKDMLKLLHSTEADEKMVHGGATYVSFIIERLFPVFISTSGRRLKIHKYSLPAKEAEMNIHLRLLREMKDTAYKAKSAWLAACWVNYRNLYLAQSNGKEWCARHLRNVTPTTVAFG